MKKPTRILLIFFVVTVAAPLMISISSSGDPTRRSIDGLNEKIGCNPSSERAQVELVVSIQTDKNSYISGENVTMLGTVQNSNGDPIADATLGIETKDSNNNTIFLDIVFSLSNGTYKDGFRLDERSISGEYHIYVTASATGYFPVINQTTFTVELPGFHNIAITNVTLPKNIVGQGFSLLINVALQNQGTLIENSNVTLRANATIIDTLTNITLEGGNSTTVAFTWNTTGFAKGNYTISGYAWPVPGETDTADNNFTGGWVVVAIVGDVNADGKVDGKDLGWVAWCFGSYPDAPPPMTWDPNADVNNDGKVDGKDLGIVAGHFGEPHS